MSVKCILRFLPLALLLALGACASKPPSQINNVCAVFSQNDGWVTNWHRTATTTSAKYGIPVNVLMATIRMESSYESRARPPRRGGFLFFPGRPISTAYGYSQALDGTWGDYLRETGNRSARRTKFADAIDFVGWYHNKSVRTLGIAPTDTYNLYLAYHQGHAGYRRGSYRSKPAITNYARRTANMADRYASQMRACGR